MSEIDTGAEALRALAVELLNADDQDLEGVSDQAAAVLRPVADERDATAAPEPAQQGNSAPIASGVEELRERVTAIIAGFRQPAKYDGLATQDAWDQAVRKTISIFALIKPLILSYIFAQIESGISATAAQARREALEAAALKAREKSQTSANDDDLTRGYALGRQAAAAAIRALDPRAEGQEAGR